MYEINTEASIIEAVKIINKNKKRFVLVVDEIGRLLGTLTDGDIRRYIINNSSIDNKIDDVYNKRPIMLQKNANFNEVISTFKDSGVDFLPIVDKHNMLINVITKSNLHVLLLTNKQFDVNYNFFELDDSLLEHEIYDRPWGFYKTTFLNDYSQSKIISVNPLGTLSLQEHKRREEYWVIIKGVGLVTIGESVKTVKEGDSIYIPKGCKHRVSNVSEGESLMISEVQLGDYFGEDDIIRYEDEYGRVK